MSEIIYKLLVMLNQKQVGSAFYNIALELLVKLDDMKDVTIEYIAKACNVSNASVSRFCRELGYEDFFDFKYCLKHDVIDKNYRSDLNSRMIDFSMDMDAYRAYYCGEVARVTSQVLETMNLPALDALVRDIHEYKTVVAMGLLHSEYACLTLQAKMLKLNKVIISLINSKAQCEYLCSAGKDTLVLLFSVTGNYFLNTLLPRMTEGDEKKVVQAKIVLLTSNMNLPKPPFVDKTVYMGGPLSPEVYKLVNNHILLSYVDLLVYRYGHYTAGLAGK